jgi:hypothetical protein
MRSPGRPNEWCGRTAAIASTRRANGTNQAHVGDDALLTGSAAVQNPYYLLRLSESTMAR